MHALGVIILLPDRPALQGYLVGAKARMRTEETEEDQGQIKTKGERDLLDSVCLVSPV